MADLTNKQALALWRKRKDSAEKQHARMSQRWKRNYRSYRGMLEQNDDQWEHQLSPPFLFREIESSEANIFDEEPVSRVLPGTPSAAENVEMIETMLDVQHKKDNWAFKVRPFGKQCLIMGSSPAKVGWGYEVGTTYEQEWIEDPETGLMKMGKVIERRVKWLDQPTFTPISVFDFMCDQSGGTGIHDLDWGAMRTWQDFDHLKMMEAAGLYENVDRLKSRRTTGNDWASNNDELFQIDRSDCYEIWELWDRPHNRLIVVGADSVVLRNEPFPFWHGELPFVVAQTIPNLYSMDAISEVEVLADLQGMLWQVINRKMDIIDLIAQAIVMVDESRVDNAEELVFAPGARWNVAPDAVQLWTPDQGVTSNLEQVQAQFITMIQDIAGGVTALGSGISNNVDPETATGMSIVQNLAQQRLLAKRNLIYQSFRRKGRQEIRLNQQLIKKPITLRVDGENGWEFQTFTPWGIAGDFDYDIEDANRSLNQQQRRQEALQLFNTLAPTAGATGLNLRMLQEAILEAFGKKNSSAYFTAAPAAAPAPGGNGGVPTLLAGDQPGELAPTTGLEPAGAGSLPSDDPFAAAA